MESKQYKMPHHDGKHVSSKFSKFYLPLIGFFALLWVALRVIPKPSRASYPCMRAAYPFASVFLAYLAGLGISTLTFAKARTWYLKKNYTIATIGMVIAFTFPILMSGDDQPAFASVRDAVQIANQPIGVAKGIFPGRVVWVHNPRAVNQNCVPDSLGHAWYMRENNYQPVIDSMVSLGLQNITGTASDSAAWRAIFEFHNASRGKGSVNYVHGEKIFIKINATSGWAGNFNTSDLSPQTTNKTYYGISETSMGTVHAMLWQLVNVVGVAQTDIYIGDPMKHIYKHLYDAWHADFPNIHYLDNSYSTLGREKVAASTTTKIYYSDRGTILRPDVWDPSRTGGTSPVYSDFLYTIYQNAEYMINIPMLKGHKRAGMTMFAKDHFGSHTRSDASHLHNGLVAPMEMENGITRSGYGLYRVQVDLMSHSILGKKNLLYLMDALWSTAYELGKPMKWQMTPFNNSYSSSIFVSLDPVAIESVGYDFLRSEFTTARGAGTYVQMDGVDDYLHQAADSSLWPNGIKYDPDSTGVLFASLGVHEHWNNAAAKEYSRNLGSGDGIELFEATSPATSIAHTNGGTASSFKLYANYPNPFNPSTQIRYDVPVRSHVVLDVYDALGKKVAVLVNDVKGPGTYSATMNASGWSSGVYFCRIHAGTFVSTQKMILAK